ncbi:tryptophan synthase subunit alpha [Ammoniphilus oxalaticus]|uniref:Tryptophan synthase alpha chain n=1 Tax=Ammoniphilus oxalaticus TaxID=66863 RepID=A0A419SN58_9BACL|nr:tryptophan synthase subunit alpha [Ammoniphilus oxalaticus]RKD25715.1 tryptophan synthase subunit alpha [Ammoniphilus oxalaticus]
MSKQTKQNRIEAIFEEKPLPLLMPFITAGDPTPEATIDICLALQEAGAGIIELGVPYSDPLADGPTIQQASLRALKNKITLGDCIELGATMRERGLEIPLVLFSYFNPVLQFGYDNLLEKMKKAGFDGLLVPDLPVEESAELEQLASSFDIPFISLVAPTSKQRIEKIVKNARGFIYCVSSLGVTGARSELDAGLSDFLDEVNALAKVPVAVGFGISRKEQVDQLSSHADGVIVGSAIVREIEQREEMLRDEAKRPQALAELKTFVQTLMSGVR